MDNSLQYHSGAECPWGSTEALCQPAAIRTGHTLVQHIQGFSRDLLAQRHSRFPNVKSGHQFRVCWLLLESC